MELSINFEIRYNKTEILSKVQQKSLENKQTKTEKKDAFVDVNSVWSAVDSIFDLGDSNIFSWVRLSEAEQKKFWEIVSKLIKAGIIGYRYYEVNGQLERHFIEWEIANPRLTNARVKYIDKKQYSLDFLV